MSEDAQQTVSLVQKWAAAIRKTIGKPEGSSNINRELALVRYIEKKHYQENFDLASAGITIAEMRGWRKGLYRAVIRFAVKNDLYGTVRRYLVEGEFASPEEAGITDPKFLARIGFKED